MTAEKDALSSPPAANTQKKVKLVPPDGGWGWMVLIGTALSNIFNQSMLSLFSLLYGDALEAMGYKTQGAAVVLSTMLFVTNFGGPMAGVLLKLTSPRFAAVTGAVLCTTGILLSGFATNIVHLIVTYGILLGMGLGFIQNSSFVAINSYFKLRKSRAVGLANVGTGVGQSLMPHVVRYLLEHYGFQGACLILAGLSLHGIGGTLLIQPVEWHMKKIEEDVVIDENLHLLEIKHKDIITRKNSKTNGVVDHNGGRRATEPSLESGGKEVQMFFSQKNLLASKNGVQPNGNGAVTNGKTEKKPTSPANKTIWRKMYDLFDISLLSSPRFINVILGTALCVSSVQNFSLVFPFYLQKVAMMDKHHTAMCMSAVALADICGRLVLPVFQDKYRIRARWMLICTSIWIIVVRQVLAYQTDLLILIAMSCLYGVGRSTTIVSRNIAISENCRIEQVPAAVGLGMLSQGLIVPPAYYFLGWIRDYTNSYIVCITVQNLLLVLFLVMWLPDMYLVWREEKKQKAKAAEEFGLS